MKQLTKESRAAVQIRAKEADAERILTGPFAATRKRIMSLFRQGMTSLQIAQDLNGSWPLENDDIGDELKAGIVRKVWETLATPEDRMLMTSIKHSMRAERNHASQNEGRDKMMREKGMKVWTTEEKEFFAELLKGSKYLRKEQRKTKKQGTRQRRKHYNHEKLAKAMNKRFGTTDFTTDRTMSRLDQLRAQEKMKDPAKRLMKLRTNVRRRLEEASMGSELLSDEGGRSDDAFETTILPTESIPVESDHAGSDVQ